MFLFFYNKEKEENEVLCGKLEKQNKFLINKLNILENEKIISTQKFEEEVLLNKIQ